MPRLDSRQNSLAPPWPPASQGLKGLAQIIPGDDFGLSPPDITKQLLLYKQHARMPAVNF
jgi:hypothetical protein